MDVNYPNIKVMGIVMMETTMMLVLMTEAIAARIIHQTDGIITAAFVSVKRMVEEAVEAVEEMVMEVSTQTRPYLFDQYTMHM